MTHITPIRMKMVMRNQNVVRPNGMTGGCIENIDAANVIGYNTLDQRISKVISFDQIHRDIPKLEMLR
jgi:hypothetical protein